MISSSIPQSIPLFVTVLSTWSLTTFVREFSSSFSVLGLIFLHASVGGLYLYSVAYVVRALIKNMFQQPATAAHAPYNSVQAW